MKDEILSNKETIRVAGHAVCNQPAFQPPPSFPLYSVLLPLLISPLSCGCRKHTLSYIVSKVSADRRSYKLCSAQSSGDPSDRQS